MLKSVRNKHHTCEVEAKFIQDRISLTERYVGELCHGFSVYSRKAARLRDKGDELAKICQDYSEAEEINETLSEKLANFAVRLSTIGDYGSKRVELINEKIVRQFGQYESICKQAKTDVKQIFTVREKELLKRRQLDRVKEKNTNRQQILQAETELVKATAEVSRSLHNVEEHTLNFERQKLNDVKYTLLDFVSIEMGYHARALELLTKAYQDVSNIDEDADLQDFKKALRKSDPSGDGKRSMFRSSQSLGSITSIFSTASKKRNNAKGQSAKMPPSKSEEILNTKQYDSEDMYNNTDDDEEDDDDDDSQIRREDQGETTTEASKSDDDLEKVSPFVVKKSFQSNRHKH